MIDVKKVIYAELKKISENVTDTYPDDWKKFPCIQFLEEENIPQEITDDTERMSYIRYKVDIWDKVSTTAAALQVNAVFASLGLNRSSSIDVPEQSYLKHKVMRFEGVVDHDTLIVYQK